LRAPFELRKVGAAHGFQVLHAVLSAFPGCRSTS
jgi:hypothetical protein